MMGSGHHRADPRAARRRPPRRASRAGRAARHPRRASRWSGEAEDGEAAVRETQLTKPDVVLMDVRMPGIDGVEATRRIRKAVPGDRGAGADDVRRGRHRLHRHAGRCPRLPAQGRRAGRDRRRHPGRGPRPGDLRRRDRVPDARALREPAGAAAPDDPFPELTAREKEILELLAHGRRTAEIAATLHLSPKTVSNNLTTIFAKLEVADRTAAVIRARERGLGG